MEDRLLPLKQTARHLSIRGQRSIDVDAAEPGAKRRLYLSPRGDDYDYAGNVELEEVRADNWEACVALEVEDDQERFVASVAYYLALCAYAESPWSPLAVRVEDTVVGFVMWGIDPDDDSFWIGGLVIDRRRQRKGHGRSVVAQLLERAVESGHEAALSYHPQNAVARAMYATMGFVETGEVADDEVVARKRLR